MQITTALKPDFDTSISYRTVINGGRTESLAWQGALGARLNIQSMQLQNGDVQVKNQRFNQDFGFCFWIKKISYGAANIVCFAITEVDFVNQHHRFQLCREKSFYNLWKKLLWVPTYVRYLFSFWLNKLLIPNVAIEQRIYPFDPLLHHWDHGPCSANLPSRYA